MERLYIVDGYGYVYRAHYGLAAGGPGRGGVRLTTADGRPTGALYVYAQMLLRLHQDVKPERVVVVFDAPGRTFRNDLDEGYKATRRETPEDLKAQLPEFGPLTEAFSWPVVAIPEVEADDTIATIASQARARGWEVTIFSADKDLMQLVGPHVQVIDSMRQKVYDRDAVVEKFGVGPETVADWLALVGDTSDNIPGVAGVGKKTAAKLLTDYGSIDGILAHASELKGKLAERFKDPEQLARLELSRKLVRLKTDVELGRDLDTFVPAPWDGDRLKQKLRELEFFALVDRLDPGDGKSAHGPVAARAPTTTIELGPPAEVALSWADVERMVAQARAAGHLAVAAVTDGDRPDRARVVGIAVATRGQAPLYLPLAHRYLSAPPQLAVDSMPSSLRELLADPDFPIWCHDGKSLRRFLGRLGVAVDGIAMDTMLAAYLIDASLDVEQLPKLAAQLLDVTLEPEKAVLGTGKKAIGFESLTVEETAAFLGGRVTLIAGATQLLRERVDAVGAGALLSDVELPLAKVLADVEERGITIDVSYLRALGERVGAQIAGIERAAYELAGEQFNLGSPKQLSALLFDKLGLRGERMKKTKTGGYSTDHEVLEGLVGAHPIVALILEHRELTKLKGTYIDALPPLINPRTGRLHTSFRQAVAATGRLSSQDPNLQNIPIRSEVGREIRRAFVAAEGFKLVSADYSQIELRVMAHLSRDPVLVRAFQDDVDVHTQTAAEVFGVELAAVDAAQRRVAKAVNYGLIYGQSEFGLARALDISREQARHYIQMYFERFATVRTFMDEVVERARRTGAADTILGRRRPIPDLGSKNFRLRTAAERVAQNTPMQGSAADIMKLAMLRVEPRLAELGAAMLLTVHDELVVEAPTGNAAQVGALLAREMEAAYRLDVPLKVDVGISDDWAGAH